MLGVKEEERAVLIRKLVRVTTCNTGRSKEVLDGFLEGGIELDGHQVLVTRLENWEKTGRYALSCRVWGRKKEVLNKKAEALGERILEFCTRKGVGCSSIYLTDERDPVMQGRRLRRCEFFPMEVDFEM